MFKTFILLSFLATCVITNPVLADSATDNYNAGMSLYSAKNYSQAVSCFNTALQIDPTNMNALQVRANCYYFLGQYANALADYQQVQAVRPTPQLADFISKLQAMNVATQPVAIQQPTVQQTAVQQLTAQQSVASQPASTLNPFLDEGVSYLRDKSYAAALDSFTKAAQQAPDNYLIYYYIGYCQILLGNYKEAVLAFGLSDLKHPDVRIETYCAQVRPKLSIEDQQWVDTQLVLARSGKTVLEKPQYAVSKTFGLRLGGGVQSFDIPWLDTLEAYQQEVAQLDYDADQNTQFNAYIPTGSWFIKVEPTYRLSPQLELGIPLTYDSLGTYTESTSYSISGTVYSSGTTISFTDLSLGVQGRYFFLIDAFQPYVGAGLIYHLVSESTPSSGGSSSGSSTGSSITGFGERFLAGIDWHWDTMFGMSLYGGYELANIGQAGGSQGSLSSGVSGSDAFDMSGPFIGLELSVAFANQGKDR